MKVVLMCCKSVCVVKVPYNIITSGFQQIEKCYKIVVYNSLITYNKFGVKCYNVIKCYNYFFITNLNTYNSVYRYVICICYNVIRHVFTFFQKLEMV